MPPAVCVLNMNLTSAAGRLSLAWSLENMGDRHAWLSKLNKILPRAALKLKTICDFTDVHILDCLTESSD